LAALEVGDRVASALPKAVTLTLSPSLSLSLSLILALTVL